MKYVVGASIGGLFGFSMPFIMDVNNIEDVNDSRIEEFQPVEETPPDNFCGYINYEATTPKEQAEECLRRSIIAVPSI